MSTKEKGERVKKFKLYFLMAMPLLLFSEIFTRVFEREICGIIFMMNLIAIPCCAIYYQVTKKNNVVLYTMFYISILIDNVYLYYMMSNYPDYARVPLLLIWRNMVIVFIIFDCKRVIDWMNRNKLTVIAVFIIISALILITNAIVVNFILKNRVFDYLSFIGLLFIVISICTIIIKDFKRKEFMEIVFLGSILFMVFRRVSLYLKITFKQVFFFDDKIISCVGLYMLLVGLFVECSCILKENNKLEKEVKIISEDIKEYQEIEKIRTQFFANISHEIKTPVNIIFSGVQLIESKEKDDNDMLKYCKKYIPSIKQNCFRILRLTNNLLDMTKLDSGSMEMKFANIDIVELVEDITMQVAEYLKNKNIDIIFDTLIEEKLIKCDKDAIQRIILNLISNSIKFTEEKGNILVYIEMKDNYVVIKVKDDGKGIVKEDRDKIFNSFVQEDKSLNRKREGSGIGLALVKAIVEKHDGDVKLGDTNKGTEVIVRLPDITIQEDKKQAKLNIECEKDIISKINTEFSDIYDL